MRKTRQVPHSISTVSSVLMRRVVSRRPRWWGQLFIFNKGCNKGCNARSFGNLRCRKAQTECILVFT